MLVTQERTRRGRVVTKMRSTDCRKPGGSAAQRADTSRFRRLHYRRQYGRIAFPTEVTLDSAVITHGRGVATWEVADSCGRGAKIKVKSGRLAVLDLATDRTIVLGPGESHTASSP